MRHINRTACRILVVDDEEANLDLIQQILLREGYTDVTVLADPHSVLGCFLDRRPDLILLDLHMPGLDGFAILDLLAPHIAPEAYLPILVLTADATREARQRALAAGAKDFVTKPFDRVELALRIRNLLDTRVLHLQLQERTQTLERLYQDAQAALGARDELLSVITHDLGQPLTAISLSARHIRYTVENGAAD
ncbi:MAG: response regulator, partial [Dehalococcoidia bacterium]